MRSFFQATLISPIFLSHSHPLHNTATDPSPPATLLRVLMQVSERVRETGLIMSMRRKTTVLHIIYMRCVLSVWLSLSLAFSHTHDGMDGGRGWWWGIVCVEEGLKVPRKRRWLHLVRGFIGIVCVGVLEFSSSILRMSWLVTYARMQIIMYCIGGWQDSGNSEVHTHQQLYGRIILILTFKDHYRQMNKRYILLYILHRAAKLISNFLTGQHLNERGRRSRPGDLLPHCRSLVNNNYLLQTVTLIKFKEESDLLLICLHMAWHARIWGWVRT